MAWSLFLGAALALVVLAALPFVLLAWYLRWEAGQTDGMAYFGKPLGERRAIKARIRRFSRPVLPLVRLIASAGRDQRTMPVFEFEGVAGPPRTSSPDVFARAKAYQPRPEDVFVVTQMRCGTTWMQQVVYEIVTRGRGDLSDLGLGHLYRLSPWIDAQITVPMDQAPVVGDRPTRIIKSHLPVDLCPHGPDARYIYVTRHPVACFASIVDYNRSLLGPLSPTLNAQADWFCSDRMYWRPWPRHVEGWWERAQAHPNVLFVHYEEMTKDFDGVRDRVAAFLGCALTGDERREVNRKCSFKYMKEHEEVFEMAPPTMFSVTGGEYLKSGKASRHEDVSPEIGGRILDYCRRSLARHVYPAERFYPDLGGGAGV